jgi:phytanoyl-CoA hydroxylase
MTGVFRRSLERFGVLVMSLSFRKNPQAALSSYQANGYFVEDALFRPEECDELIEHGRRLPGAVAGEYRPVMQPHRQDPFFLNALRDRRIIEIMTQLVGGRPSGIQTEFFFGKPGIRGFSKHQDNFFVEAPTDAFASAWIALVDVPREKGALTGFPGSHKEGKLPVRKLELGPAEGQDPNANNEETELPPQYKGLDLSVAKGSVVFLHSYFVHSSRANETADFRYVLLCTYVREGVPFRAGNYAKREAIAV